MSKLEIMGRTFVSHFSMHGLHGPPVLVYAICVKTALSYIRSHFLTMSKAQMDWSSQFCELVFNWSARRVNFEPHGCLFNTVSGFHGRYIVVDGWVLFVSEEEMTPFELLRMILDI